MSGAKPWSGLILEKGGIFTIEVCGSSGVKHFPITAFCLKKYYSGVGVLFWVLIFELQRENIKFLCFFPQENEE